MIYLFIDECPVRYKALSNIYQHIGEGTTAGYRESLLLFSMLARFIFTQQVKFKTRIAKLFLISNCMHCKICLFCLCCLIVSVDVVCVLGNGIAVLSVFSVLYVLPIYGLNVNCLCCLIYLLSSWHLTEVRKSVMEEAVKSEEAAGCYAHWS